MELERERAEELGYASPICKDKAATDKSFNQGLKTIIENLDHVSACVGTHNKDSCLHAIDWMQEQGVDLSDRRVEFSQLYGMSDVLSFNLVHHGLSVSKYLPYGPIVDVMPYLIRRADENTAISGQTSRELQDYQSERLRRQAQS
jgi:proline dehydrogenase